MSQIQLSSELIDSYEYAGYTNRELSQKEIAKMLDGHGINRRWVNGCLMVGDCFDGEDVEVLTDTTNWTLFNVLSFLNY